MKNCYNAYRNEKRVTLVKKYFITFYRTELDLGSHISSMHALADSNGDLDHSEEEMDDIGGL